MRQFIQCRLRRSHLAGLGHSEMVAYLPTHGTNGRAVTTGRSVTITGDRDACPWLIVAASDQRVDQGFMTRKRDEGRNIAGVIR